MVNLAISLIIILSVFISSPVWADENSNFDEQLAHIDNIRSSQPKLFLVLINELNQQSNNLSSTQRYHLDYLNIYLLTYQGNLTEAISSSKNLINSNADALLKFRAKRVLINIFAANQNWSEGLSTLSRMLAELTLIKDKEAQLQGFLLAAIFYNQLEQYSLALSYAKQVESQSDQGRDQCIAKAEIIKASFQLKQLTPTDPIINHAISLCRINKEQLIISFINSFVAEMHLENHQQYKALQILNSSLQDTLNTKYPRIIAKYHALLAHAHWINKNAELTKQLALKALDNENNEGTAIVKVLSYQLLFKVAESQKDFELALLYHQKYAIADKLYYDEIQTKHLAFQLAEHKSIEQQNKINLLNEKNSLLTTEQALIRANVENTRLILMVLALTLAVLVFWGYRLLRAHKRIKELAEYDALTGAFNRGHFIDVANNALKYCQSAKQELSLIMFDLDHFKNVNDTYGHACGDWALKAAVDACKSMGRHNDIFTRLGGEEFCILLTSCDSQAALKRAEACRKAIAAIITTDSGFDFTITASFGVTDDKISGYDLEKLLADADSATYVSKHTGRNKVTLFQPEKQGKLPLV